MKSIISMNSNLNLTWILGLIILAVIIGGTIYIIIMKEEEEDYLALKIIGFYLLGSFRFIFSYKPIYLYIPVGILFYFFFMRKKERKNAYIKKMAVIFGFIIMCACFIEDITGEKIKYSNHIVTTQNDKFYNLNDDWQYIKKELNIDYAIINDFNLSLNKDNTIENLSYNFEGDNKYYNVIYENGRYKIKVNKIELDDNGYAFNYTHEGSNVNVDRFMSILENVSFEKHDETGKYIMEYSRDIGEELYNDMKTEYMYLIDEYNYDILKVNKERDIDVYSAITYSAIDKSSNTNINDTMYLIDYAYQNRGELEEDLYSGLKIVVEDKLNNINEVITEPAYINDIVDILQEINYTKVNDLDVDLYPTLFLSFNDGKKIGLCENEGFIKVESDGLSTWYVVLSNSYEKIKNDINLYLAR